VTARKICVTTTSRADYGLLHHLLREIQADPDLQLQVIAAAMHMSPEFGLTYRHIEQDGFQIDKKIDMLLSADSEAAAAKSVGIGMISFTDAFQALKPEILVLLGDRFELLSAAAAALILKIPIAHIHGGETSQGAVDEAVRHAVTKMASLHFPATEEYRARIIQMGENPEHVFNFGAPGLDHLYREKLMSRVELEEWLQLQLKSPVAIVTYHPVTLGTTSALSQVQNLLLAVTESGVKAVFTKANADAHGREINREIASFCESNPARFRFFDNLGQKVYLSCLKNLDLMIGNSSSGLTEAPSFKLPAVNIGQRQKGRTRAANVIDTGYDSGEILEGIRKANSSEFRNSLSDLKNPYDRFEDGKTSHRIKETLKNAAIEGEFLQKKFIDLDF
jgi:UDP-N-acetylglucosamine 2-epimerase (non-hydrolysing)/GDP/UDP-N,N'-diacetylbacillosamine 2-epimerase (hydrolysing)